MTKEEATKKLADIIFNAAKSGYMPYDTNDEMCAMNIAKEHIDEFYISLPSNLDEAAQKVEDYYDVGEEHGYLYCHRGDIKDAFKAGAEWMAGQGETVEGDVDGNWRNQEDVPYEIYVTSDCLPQDTEFKFGDKVVVQIRKK